MATGNVNAGAAQPPSPPGRRWRRWSAELSGASGWVPPPGQVLVVVPHPDDEVLATGALLAHSPEVRILAVTDGEAAYPAEVPATRLAERRRAEQEAALRELGVPAGRACRLGLPDGLVADHERALAAAIAVAARGCALVVAPWPSDHHCDHEACGRAARTAVAALARCGPAPMLVHSVFWGWHHAEPTGGQRWLRLPVDQTTQQRRWAALAHHRSQVTTDLAHRPILRPKDLEPLGWDGEHYAAGVAG